jgi:hypothetical protein
MSPYDFAHQTPRVEPSLPGVSQALFTLVDSFHEFRTHLTQGDL